VRGVERGDATQRWPHADGSMDLVTMVFSLEVLPDAALSDLLEGLGVLGE